MALNVVLLVGGVGSRLRPLSYEKPKPLMPIVGRPALEHLIERLPAAPIWLTAGYGFEHFERFVRRFPRLHLVRELEPLGTGGALANLRTRLEGELLVLNGDTFVNFDALELLEQHRSSRAFASILGVKVPDPGRYGELRVESGILQEFREKAPASAGPGLINAGVYVLSQLPEQQPCSLERDVFPGWLESGRTIRVWPCQGQFLDIGTPEAYLDAQQMALDGKLGLDCGAEARPEQSLWIAADAEIGPEVTLSGPVVIGPGARVGAGTRLERCVLWEGARIGPGCQLSNSVVGSRVEIPAGTVANGLMQVNPGGN